MYSSNQTVCIPLCHLTISVACGGIQMSHATHDLSVGVDFYLPPRVLANRLWGQSEEILVGTYVTDEMAMVFS